MITSKREVLNQIKFCKELMERLYIDCLNNIEKTYEDMDEPLYTIDKGTVMAQDSIRLRRELNKFNQMVIYNGN